MRKTGSELVERRQDTAPVAYGRKLNNRARAVVHDALSRLIDGDSRDLKGSHGATFADRLRDELLESPLASMLRIDAATPSDEGDAKSGPTMQINTQALYLQALQHANKPEEPKTIEGTIGVQPEPSGW